MNWLHWIIRRRNEAKARLKGQSSDRRLHKMNVQLYEGQVGLEVVGEASYQDSLWRIVGGRRSSYDEVRNEIYSVLVAEVDNEHDPNAVSVWVEGLKVGYLSRDNARIYRPGLLSLRAKHGKPIALPGVIVGGGMGEDGPRLLGVFLRHDPVDFGLAAPSPIRQAATTIRTGFSDAFATDLADETHDMSWVANLPQDDVRAISKLRQLLKDERDPIDRHFMFSNLEAALYRSRGAFASALDEYDQACRMHDSEMDSLREAFLAKWGKIPLLETYRQMCIRQQRAKDFEQALWWAERGIAIYGPDGARAAAVEDLRKRAEAYRGKLKPSPLSSP